MLVLAAAISKKTKHLYGVAEQQFVAKGERAAAKRPQSTDTVGDDCVATGLARQICQFFDAFGIQNDYWEQDQR